MDYFQLKLILVVKSININSYSVFFGVPAYRNLYKLIVKNKYEKILILTDLNTKKHCLTYFEKQLLYTDTENIKNIIYNYSIKAGESSKNLNQSRKIWEFLIENGFKRNSLMINLGGGLITDIGGFISSTYLRGIDFVNIPTSLLGMVDASIGGKTGIDLNNLKNIIGTFKYPKMIIVDQLFLKSISKRQINSGFAEMIKHSLIDSESHWEKIKKINSTSEITNDLVFESIMTKVNIVKNDPTESNVRKYLNFGHTLGHAIESYLLNSERELLHGESILIGLILELYISNVKMNFDLDLVKEIKIIIEKFSKKVNFLEEDIIQIIDLLKYDKKNEKEIPLFVLLESIGKPIFGIIVSKTDILNAFEFYDN